MAKPIYRTDPKILIPVDEIMPRAQALGFSQQWLADITGLSHDTIRKIVRHMTAPANESHARLTAAILDAEGKEVPLALERYRNAPKGRSQLVSADKRKRGLMNTMMSHGTGVPGCRMCPLVEALGSDVCVDYDSRNINCPAAMRLFQQVLDHCQSDRYMEMKADRYAYELVAKLVVRIRYADRILEVLGWERPDTSDERGKKAKWWLEQQDRWVSELGRWMDRTGLSRIKRDMMKQLRGNDLATMFTLEAENVPEAEMIDEEE